MQEVAARVALPARPALNETPADSADAIRGGGRVNGKLIGDKPVGYTCGLPGAVVDGDRVDETLSDVTVMVTTCAPASRAP